jgi:hypothetical protein
MQISIQRAKGRPIVAEKLRCMLITTKPYEIPPFPKTHFWQKTNNNPEMIEKRRMGLENYFSHVINDPYLRGYP